MSVLLQVTSISHQNNGVPSLQAIDFSQQPLQKIVIAGETGSGKSTLLKIIAGLEQPHSGQILFNGKKVLGPAYQLVPGHPKIAYLSQQFELPKFLRVQQVLEYANTMKETNASSVFSICKINHLLERKTNDLSGGEKQRIALARLLIQKPKLLLLDEPFSNLDRSMKQTLKAVIDTIGKRLKITCILVSHEPQDTLPWADHILVLKEGKIVQQGPAKHIYRQPINSYVAGLFGAYSVLNKKLIDRFGIITDAKSIVLRPENFRVVQPGESSVEGRVENIQYQGDHQLLSISLDSTLIHVKNYFGRFTIGDVVSVMVTMRSDC